MVKKIIAIAIICLNAQLAFTAQKKLITVAKNGSGNFSTIQAAINSIPADNASNIVIYIKNGVYNEHVLIDKSHLSLIGESRENTRIEYAIDREQWKQQRKRTLNNGTGVIDIGIAVNDTATVVAVSNIVIGNLTVVNTINDVNVYTHTVRGEGSSTKIWIVHCNVWARGKDTIGLWNKTTGMYYHTDCSFKGGIDAVCPRGWCYAAACDFYQTASSAPIWHEGLEGTSQKFVIRTPYIDHDSTRTFKLTNGQKAFKIYILDGVFSEKVSGPGLTSSVYYHNCKGGLKDTTFYRNNLVSATGSPRQNKITARWTFEGADDPWDPENVMPSVLPYSAIPQPWNRAYEISSNINLKWIKGRDATTNAVYFGTTNPPQYVQSQIGTSYQPEKLNSGTYYWRIDAINGTDTVKGAVWSFTVDESVAAIDKNNVFTSKKTFFNAALVSKSDLCITYAATNASPVKIKLYNTSGKELVKFQISSRSSGIYTETFNLTSNNLSSGMYMVRFISENVEMTTPVVLK